MEEMNGRDSGSRKGAGQKKGGDGEDE